MTGRAATGSLSADERVIEVPMAYRLFSMT